MEKNDLEHIRIDLKYKRDALYLSHQVLKQEADYYQKIIIFTSLASGIFESIKMRMNLTQPALQLLPIILTSFVCGISSYVKFKQYAERQEVLIQSTTILTNTLNQVRNTEELTDEIIHAYNHSLELLEISLYPDIRRKFLKISQRNMEGIIKNENCYFDNLNRVNNGLKIKKCDSESESETENIIIQPPKQSDKKLDKIDERDDYDNL
tara:strand:+ start:3341 stop:3967 length:627 start_codon:yes stop_codon:yes gene_type:complete